MNEYLGEFVLGLYDSALVDDIYQLLEKNYIRVLKKKEKLKLKSV